MTGLPVDRAQVADMGMSFDEEDRIPEACPELIRARNLDESFGDQYNPLVRQAYLQCYDQKIEEDRYNPEIHDQYPDEAGQ